MKKLITLLLVLCGGISQASAAKLYVNVDNIEDWWYNDDAQLDMYSWEEGNNANNTGWDDHTSHIINPVFMYGGRWYIYEMPAGHNRAIVRRYANGSVVNQTYDITVTEDYYIYLVDKSEEKLGWNVVTAPAWTGLCVRSSVDGYDGYTNNMVCSDSYNTFTKTYEKADFGDAAYFYFRLKHIENVRFGEDGTYFNTWTQVGPTTNDTELSLPGNVATKNQFSDATYNNWKITLPSYDYDKIVITAKYVNTDGAYEWQISADAYISKTLGASEGGTYYGTFGSAANVDFTNVTGLTAKKLKVSEGNLVETAATTLYGGEGALLSAASAGPFLIPVAATASADAENNQLVAITSKQQLAQTTTGYTNYILTNTTVAGSKALAFYKVNVSGSWVSAGSAYLKVPDSSTAREYFLLNGENITGVEKVEAANATVQEFFNLAGQRVSKPTKGLYIVNGKKVIIK